MTTFFISLNTRTERISREAIKLLGFVKRIREGFKLSVLNLLSDRSIRTGIRFGCLALVCTVEDKCRRVQRENLKLASF